MMPVRDWRRWQEMLRQVRLPWEAGRVTVAAGVISVPRRPGLDQAGARAEEASTLSAPGAARCTRASQGSPEAHLPTFRCTLQVVTPPGTQTSLNLEHSEFPRVKNSSLGTNFIAQFWGCLKPPALSFSPPTSPSHTPNTHPLYTPALQSWCTSTYRKTSKRED